MTALGVPAIGAEALGGAFIRSLPVVAVTAPSGTVGTSTTTATWTYTSAVPRAQAAYRVRLLSQDGSVELFNTGIMLGADVTFAVPFLLGDSSTYLAAVSCSDGYDWSVEATSSFTTDLADVSDYPPIRTVGTQFEIALNGVGYMLVYKPEENLVYRRQVAGLDPPRLATSSTPFSEAIERYSFVTAAEWSGGAGQRLANRAGSIDSGYYDSEGINPFETGQVSLLPATVNEVSSTYATPLACVASDHLYMLTGAKQLSRLTAPGGTPSAFSVAAAGTFTSLTSDGTHWYAADGAGVYRNSTNADPGAAWSTLDCTMVEWCSDRLAGVYESGGTTRFTTFTPSGTEEVAGGRIQLTGATITGITSGDGYVWFGARRGQHRSVVYAWKLGTTDSPFVAFEIPAGQSIGSLGFYQGNVFLRAFEAKASGARAVIYRCAAQSGALSAVRVTAIDDGAVDHSVGTFAGDDRFVLWSWSHMHDNNSSGVACLDLSTGGVTKWLVAEGATGNTMSVFSWAGRVGFTVAGSGAYVEGTAPVASGWFETSHADLGVALDKVLDEVQLLCDPLPSGGGIAYSFSLDGGNSFTSLPAASIVTPGTKRVTAGLDKQTSTIGSKVTLTASGASPVVRAVMVRLHPYGIADQVVVLPINCSDAVPGLNGTTNVSSGPGKGAARARVLEALAQTRVLFQDIDWAYTKTSEVWEVQSVEVRSVGIQIRSQNQQGFDQVAVVTLRRKSK